MENQNQVDPNDLLIRSFHSEQNMQREASEHSQWSQQQASNFKNNRKARQQDSIFKPATSEQLGSEEHISPESSNSQEAKTDKSKSSSDGSGKKEQEGLSVQVEQVVSEVVDTVAKQVEKKQETNEPVRIEQKQKEQQDAGVESVTQEEKQQQKGQDRLETQPQTEPSQPQQVTTSSITTKSLQMVRTIDLHQTIVSPPKLPTINLPTAGKAKPWERFTLKKPIAPPASPKTQNQPLSTTSPNMQAPAGSTLNPLPPTESTNPVVPSPNQEVEKKEDEPKSEQKTQQQQQGPKPVLKLQETNLESKSSTKTQILGAQTIKPVTKVVNFEAKQPQKSDKQDQVDKKSQEGKSNKEEKEKQKEDQSEKYINPFEVYYKRFQEQKRKQRQAKLKEPLPKITEKQEEQAIQSEKPAQPSDAAPAITHQLSEKLHREHKQENFDEFKGVEISEPQRSSSGSAELIESGKRESEVLRGAKIRELEQRLRLQQESIHELSGEMALHHKSLMSFLAGMTVGGMSWVLRRNPALSMLLGLGTSAACFLLTK